MNAIIICGAMMMPGQCMPRPMHFEPSITVRRVTPVRRIVRSPVVTVPSRRVYRYYPQQQIQYYQQPQRYFSRRTFTGSNCST